MLLPPGSPPPWRGRSRRWTQLQRRGRRWRLSRSLRGGRWQPTRLPPPRTARRGGGRRCGLCGFGWSRRAGGGPRRLTRSGTPGGAGLRRARRRRRRRGCDAHFGGCCRRGWHCMWLLMPPPPSHPSQSRFGRHPHLRCTPLASAFYSPVASVFRILCSLRQSRSPPLLSPPPPPPPTPPTLRQQYCCACCLHPSKGLVLDEPRRQRRRWQQAAAVCLPCRRGAWVSLALPVRMCNRARCGVRWTASPPPLAAFAPRRQQQSSGSGDGGGARSAPTCRRWRKPLQGGGGGLIPTGRPALGATEPSPE